MADEEWPGYVAVFGIGLTALIVACVATKGFAALVAALVVACVMVAA